MEKITPGVYPLMRFKATLASCFIFTYIVSHTVKRGRYSKYVTSHNIYYVKSNTGKTEQGTELILLMFKDLELTTKRVVNNLLVTYRVVDNKNFFRSLL